MNPKYRKYHTAATTSTDFRISGKVANVAALIVIVASLFETTAIMGVMPSANVTAGACSAPFVVPAGEHSAFGQCQK
jgi:hypothetical protein